MKEFWIAGGIFLVSCLTVFLLTLSTTKTAEDLLTEANAMYTAYEENESAEYEEKLFAFLRKWEEAERFLTVTVHHEELSRVGRAIRKAEGAAKAGDSGLLSLSLSELCDALTHVYDMVRLSLDNII